MKVFSAVRRSQGFPTLLQAPKPQTGSNLTQCAACDLASDLACDFNWVRFAAFRDNVRENVPYHICSAGFLPITAVGPDDRQGAQTIVTVVEP